MTDIEGVLAGLDAGTAVRVRHALPTLGLEDLGTLTQYDVQRFLWQTLPRAHEARPRERHEVAWAFGDFLEAAGLVRYAALCRDRRTHELLSAWSRDPEAGERAAEALLRESGVQPPDTVLLRFSREPIGREAVVHAAVTRMLEAAVAEGRLNPAEDDGQRRTRTLTETFLSSPSAADHGMTPREVVLRFRALRWIRKLDPDLSEFWRRSLDRLVAEPTVPANVVLSTAPAEALLQVAEEGPVLTRDGHLPEAVVQDLDVRFAWSERLPYGSGPARLVPGEQTVPALLFLDRHLRSQGLLTESGGRLALTQEGRCCLTDRPRLWQALVSPRPRWAGGFEQDALAAMAASLLRRTPWRAAALTDHTAALLSSKWSSGDGLASEIEWLRVEWYRLGVALSWWELSRRGDDYRLSEFGRAAAAELFWAVAARPLDQ